jgi:SAM-dependent methyltransferase
LTPDPVRRVEQVGNVGSTTRGCPVCGSTDRVEKRVVEGWELAACAGCGFLYAPRTRSNSATEVELEPDFEPWRARHRQVERLLRRLVEPGDLVVDIGAGFGELGRLLSGSDLRYVGFEPSISVSDASTMRGVTLRSEIFTPQSLEEPAGAVVLNNVIEHVIDPVGLLTDGANALRPGGVLVVIVPNRYDIRQALPSWRDSNHWIPPEHINYFSPASLRAMFARLGIESRPFGFKALTAHDWKYWPRAALEQVRVFPFGLNVYGRVPDR